MSRLPPEVADYLPIFKVWADEGKHPPVALDRPVCVIGRREIGVNLPLRAPQVSKLHALVVRTQQRVYVRDLASRNGVQRNGAPVQEVGLSDEDVLRIGSYTLQCASGFGHGDEPTADNTGAAAANDVPLPPAELIGPDGLTYPFPVGQHTLLIGQRDGCEVRLEGDDEVAPVHAILFEMDGKRYVRDLGAPAGTFLNIQSIHQSELNPGDTIRAGSVTLRYALVDIAAEGEDAAATREALGVDDSAPGIDLVDSVATNANVATADSMIVPEITMEDSRTSESQPRQASPISEYDMDVVDDDPRRESTFAGEVIAEGAGPSAVTPDHAKPARPELPPATPASLQRGLDDSAIPIAGSFHDNILDDHLLQDVDDPHAQSRGPLTMADDVHDTGGAVPATRSGEPTTEPPKPTAEKPVAGPEPQPPAPPIAAEAPKPAAAEAPAPDVPVETTPSRDAAKEVISQLVDEVSDRVGQVSEKVEMVAAKVERVAQKMTEVTKDVSEVAQTAETLQEAWSEFREGERDDHPGTSDKSTAKDGDRTGEKGNPERDLSRESRKTSAEPQSES